MEDHFPHLCLFSAVTNFNSGLEASSDSDDEDKLHIVEEDSLQEPEGSNTNGTTLQDNHDAATTVLTHNGLNGGMIPPQKQEDDFLSVCRFSLLQSFNDK